MSGETWHGLVRRIAQEYEQPEPTVDDAEFILWERTAFPFAKPDHVERQVRDYFEGARP